MTDRGALWSVKIRYRATRDGALTRLVTKTMSKDDFAGNQTRAGSMATIARADRAYHDVAQLHLHEFGGGA